MKKVDPDTSKAISLFLDKARDSYNILGVILFGSRARGDFQKDSDADLAVILPDGEWDFVATKLAMADMAFDVMLDVGIRISPLPLQIKDISHPDEHLNPDLIRNITTEGVAI